MVAPAPRIGLVRHVGLGLYWLGTYFVVTPVYTILLQVQISQAVASHDTQNLVTGIATGIGGFLAMVIPPLVGHDSDRLHSRWGRRKPILVAGTLGIVLCLVFLRMASSLPAIVVGFGLTVATINVASAAYVAVIPDTVHDAETGRASGFLGLFVGKLFTDGIAALTRDPAIITADTIVKALVFAAGTGLIFGMYPAIRASRLNPIEALRTE